MSKKRKKKIQWIYFTERLSFDFPFIIVYYFLIGHFKYLGFRNLLYFNKYPKVYAYRGKKEFERFYKKIRSFKKKDLINIIQETKLALDQLDFWLKKITLRNLEKNDKIELKQDFRGFNQTIYKFASYFIFVQYIGCVFQNDEKILKLFDTKTLRTIRVEPLIQTIRKKLKIYFDIIGKRSFIKSSLLFWASPLEIENLLKGQKINIEELEKKLKERKRCSLLAIRNGKKYIYLGLKAKKVADEELDNEQLKLEVSKISGQGICFKNKKIKGRVKIVLDKKDFKKIKQGDILVAVATMPYYLSVLKKTKAFITEVGGLLSHASVLARELKKPCVIGTRIATKVLKDGDLVEVDTNKGLVKIIK